MKKGRGQVHHRQDEPIRAKKSACNVNSNLQFVFLAVRKNTSHNDRMMLRKEGLKRGREGEIKRNKG